MRRVKTAEVLSVYNENSKNVEATARLFGVTNATVRYHINKQSVVDKIASAPVSSTKNSTSNKVTINKKGCRTRLEQPEIDLIIKEYTVVGLSLKEIAVKYRRGVNTISALLNSVIGDDYVKLRGKGALGEMVVEEEIIAEAVAEEASAIEEPSTISLEPEGGIPVPRVYKDNDGQAVPTLVFYGDYWYAAPIESPLLAVINAVKLDLEARGMSDVEVVVNKDSNLVVPCSFTKLIRYDLSTMTPIIAGGDIDEIKEYIATNEDNQNMDELDTVDNLQREKCEIVRMYLSHNYSVYDLSTSYDKTPARIHEILVEKLGVNFATIRRLNAAASKTDAVMEEETVKVEQVKLSKDEAVELETVKDEDLVFRIVLENGESKLMYAHDERHVMEKLLKGIKISYVASRNEIAGLVNI